MGGEFYSEIPNKEKEDDGLIKHIQTRPVWWLMCALAMFAVVVSEMSILGKITWVGGLALMAYWAPIWSEYLNKKMFS